ncbi:hypothetical protein C2857_003989 [Epichloe festucae Fl1]|uniref:Uncharacterized protein n=1 Tax=Epichloe festucae (strain Fl1) TaxID=877507 RepID=A0A7U3SNB7_EPIFF|nr:hypothetical protein C2857_003989 [Epichloe festucae Fl1]
MNRPRNRQPRPPRHGPKSNGPSGNPPRGSPAATPQQATGTVPTSLQVVAGASVFIVLKEDQPTGKETAGVVAELLTQGNHPRGIKVRLQSGQAGRVQRMGNDSAARMTGTEAPNKSSRSSRFSHRYTDVRSDLDHPSEPPARSLADFLPPSHDEGTILGIGAGVSAAVAYVAVPCPFCDFFEGDEAAVTYHIEREHLT